MSLPSEVLRDGWNGVLPPDAEMVISAPNMKSPLVVRLAPRAPLPRVRVGGGAGEAHGRSEQKITTAPHGHDWWNPPTERLTIRS